MDLTAEDGDEGGPDGDEGGPDGDEGGPDGDEGGTAEAAAAAGRSASALALRFERDELIRVAADAKIREGIKLRKGRRARAQKQQDSGAWRRGQEDAAKLSTGRTLA